MPWVAALLALGCTSRTFAEHTATLLSFGACCFLTCFPFRTAKLIAHTTLGVLGINTTCLADLAGRWRTVVLLTLPFGTVFVVATVILCCGEVVASAFVLGTGQVSAWNAACVCGTLAFSWFARSGLWAVWDTRTFAAFLAFLAGHELFALLPNTRRTTGLCAFGTDFFALGGAGLDAVRLAHATSVDHTKRAIFGLAIAVCFALHTTLFTQTALLLWAICVTTTDATVFVVADSCGACFCAAMLVF